MGKARNMIIDGYRKGLQLQMDNIGLFYMFNGREPISDIDIESYEILSEETSRDIVSTVGRGLVGSAIFGMAGATASLTGRENKIYTIRVNWDRYIWKDGCGYSVFELDEKFYKMFILKCTRTEQYQKELDEWRNRPPEKYLYNYAKWLQHNNLKDEYPKINDTYWEALLNDKDTNPILDCCRSINPKWEEYIKQQEQQTQQAEVINSDNSDIKLKLRQLKSMYEEELITEEEYNAKKQELLDKL